MRAARLLNAVLDAPFVVATATVCEAVGAVELEPVVVLALTTVDKVEAVVEFKLEVALGVLVILADAAPVAVLVKSAVLVTCLIDDVGKSDAKDRSSVAGASNETT